MNDDTPAYWTRAKRALGAQDPVLKEIMRVLPGRILRRRPAPFLSLARSIVGQQISVAAAESIWQRLTTAAQTIEPHTIVELDEITLRSCGLSGRKATYLRDLGQRFLDRSLEPETWPALDDEGVIATLTTVKGIGRWTAEMFLMFHLQRPNVLPLGDVGLQRAMNLAYNKGRALSERKIKAISAKWEPWRSVATWYLWRSLELPRRDG
jgi:DNA-3-methyladenine glycosylase II